MNRILKMLVMGALFLAGLALWALGAHFTWSAGSVLVAAVTLAVVSVVVYL